MLGAIAHQTGENEIAVDLFTKALAIKPNYVGAHINLAAAFKNLGKLEAAIASLKRALAIKPDLAIAHRNLGIAQQALGESDEAMVSFRKALAINPRDGTAHRHLASIKKFSEHDDDVTAMETAWASPGMGDDQKMHLAFGLGKVFEDLRQYEKAFSFFSTGNAIKRRTYDFSIRSVENYFEKLKGLFTEDFFASHKNAGSPDETPIFILGMPRSGTTLVEQILASHPKVTGAGELDYLGRTVDCFFKEIGQEKFTDGIYQADQSLFSAFGDKYIDMLRNHSSTACFITDKMPGNFFLIGMIKVILPRAKIVHCLRDPVDTCVSIFKNFFTSDAMRYADNLVELGQYYCLYRDLMNHWQQVLPEFTYSIQYENLVEDQEKQARLLLDYCGLEWNDQCLNFHRTDRAVHTISYSQVRKPIYNSSVRSWKRYEKWLSPLIENLQ